MTDISAWTELAEKIHEAGVDIFATANVAITDKGFKVVPAEGFEPPTP
jgi:hypothetical protein